MTGVGPAEVRIGTSGWSYRDWREVVYDGASPRSWFDRYALRFDTVELNATFYRLPEATTVDHWARRAPEGFRYALKLGRFGTHRKKLVDPATWLARHVERLDHLGHTLGPTVVQLPPRWRRDAARLDAMLDAAHELRPTWPWAVELRDPSWLHDEVFAVLERHGAALVLHDLLPEHPVLLTAGWTYLRFHGPEALERPYHGRYGADRLAPWADRIDQWAAAGVDCWAYFNNDVGAAAVTDAEWLRDRVSSVPPAGTAASADPPMSRRGTSVPGTRRRGDPSDPTRPEPGGHR